MNPYEALGHAIRAHGDETDWCGKLYIFHPMAVADRLVHNFQSMSPSWGFSLEDAVVVALLHDVWEDTDYELSHAWFTELQWDGLERVTRWPTETYREYVEKAAGLPLSCVVKLADLSHNMSDERKENLSEEQMERARSLEAARYIPSRARLWEALGAEWWPA